VTLPAGSLTSQAKALVGLVSTGGLSATVATEIASLLTAAARVEEIDQLRDELKALRTILEGRHDRH